MRHGVEPPVPAHRGIRRFQFHTQHCAADVPGIEQILHAAPRGRQDFPGNVRNMILKETPHESACVADAPPIRTRDQQQPGSFYTTTGYDKHARSNGGTMSVPRAYVDSLAMIARLCAAQGHRGRIQQDRDVFRFLQIPPPQHRKVSPPQGCPLRKADADLLRIEARRRESHPSPYTVIVRRSLGTQQLLNTAIVGLEIGEVQRPTAFGYPRTLCELAGSHGNELAAPCPGGSAE